MIFFCFLKDPDEVPAILRLCDNPTKRLLIGKGANIHLVLSGMFVWMDILHKNDVR